MAYSSYTKEEREERDCFVKRNKLVEYLWKNSKKYFGLDIRDEIYLVYRGDKVYQIVRHKGSCDKPVLKFVATGVDIEELKKEKLTCQVLCCWRTRYAIFIHSWEVGTRC